MIVEPNAGAIVSVDGAGRFVVEANGLYASPRPHPIPGVRVRSVEGGRARVVAIRRLQLASDRYGRQWRLPSAELCAECGQPDNCGDCTHAPLTDEEAAELGAVNA